MSLKPGLKARMTRSIKEVDSALQWGSEMPVLSSPALIGMLEQVCAMATDHLLPNSKTTVGFGFEVQHLAPTPIGATLQIEAFLRNVDGEKLTFDVEAEDGNGRVCLARLQRAIVTREVFLSRVEHKRMSLRSHFQDEV